MLESIFNYIMSILVSLIQIIVYPINQIISTTLPDFSEQLTNLGTSISSLFTSITWALGLIPNNLILTLLFIISVEIARHSIFISTHIINMIITLIHKLKFW